MYQPKTAIFAHHFTVMKLRHIIFSLIFLGVLNGCANHESSSISIISWGGISAQKADTLYSLAKECGFDTHLGLYSTQENALSAAATLSTAQSRK